MQKSHVLYSANEQNYGEEERRIPRWVDTLFFFGMVLAIGIVLGVSWLSDDPGAWLFIHTALWVMSILIGVFVLMLLIDRMGVWGLLGLVPLALLGVFWGTGSSGHTLFHHWSQLLVSGLWQMAKVVVYGFVGIAGLGLLARLVEKVGIVGFLATLVIASGMALWLISG